MTWEATRTCFPLDHELCRTFILHWLTSTRTPHFGKKEPAWETPFIGCSSISPLIHSANGFREKQHCKSSSLSAYTTMGNSLVFSPLRAYDAMDKLKLSSHSCFQVGHIKCQQEVHLSTTKPLQFPEVMTD